MPLPVRCHRQMRGNPCGFPNQNILPENLMPSRLGSDGFFVFILSWCVRFSRHTSMNEVPTLSVRCQSGNRDHHIWDNNGTFWCHFTVHLPDFTKQRLRVSLDTADIGQARRLRDALFALFGCVLPA